MSLGGKRILIVEDEPIVTMMLKGMLSALGAHVVGAAATEAQACALAESADIDAAILDVNLQGERSFAAATALRRRRVPFIFATGYGSHADPRCDGSIVVEKPYRQEEVAAALEKALRVGVRD